MSSTSNISVANGGIEEPAPPSPYPNIYGIKKRYLAPSCISCNPSVQPAITWFRAKEAGSPLCTLLSKTVPSIRNPS